LYSNGQLDVLSLLKQHLSNLKIQYINICQLIGVTIILLNQETCSPFVHRDLGGM
jgi:hypothetical protein